MKLENYKMHIDLSSAHSCTDHIIITYIIPFAYIHTFL